LENTVYKITGMALLYSGIINFLMGTLLLISCQKPNSAEEKQQIVQKDMKNMSYGSNSVQLMDIYLPAGRDSLNTKVMLFVHGGSWSGGDKLEFDSAIAALRRRLPDYAFFNMNYRLAGGGKNRYPAQLDDIKNALSFIEKNAEDYKINASKVVLVGASAGAHLSLLYAYKNNSDGKIRAVVDLFGPTDLTRLYNNHPVPSASQPVLVNLLGATPATNPSLYHQTSPISFVNERTVPTLIFHGASDFIVPISQSTALKTKLEAADAKVEMVVYPSEGHGWYGPSLANTIEKTAAFVKQNVQ
jgi:acetyl esterase/lipase